VPLGEFFVEFLDGAGHADRSCKSVVFTIGGLLWNDVHAKLVVFDMAHGEQDGAMPQKRCEFFEHGDGSFSMEWSWI
jgi:hypothetical protein